MPTYTPRKAERVQLKLRLALTGPDHSGKAQPLTAKILTPHGWTAMGALNIGDEVMGSDGLPHHVTGIFPQGRQPIYRITCTDGASTECTNDHLWLTQTVLDRAARRNGTPKSLKDIREQLLNYRGQHNQYIPLVKPLEFASTAQLPIDPYLLGLLLGDGTMTHKALGWSNPETELQEAVATLLPEDVKMVETGEGSSNDFRLTIGRTGKPHPLIQRLKQLGLMRHKSTQKFIPTAYLLAPIPSRIALLQGLLDTDGSAYPYTLEYSTSSPALANDVKFLVQSLGGTVTTGTRIPTYTYKGERRKGTKSYRLWLSLTPDIQPFRLSRKLLTYTPKTKYLPQHSIDRIDDAGIAEVQCIAVDAPDQMYVTDDCLLTHNTLTSLYFAYGMGGRVCVIDTDHGNSEKYVGLPDVPEFDVIVLDDYTPEGYIDAIQGAQGYDVLVVDTVTQEWKTSLELRDDITLASPSQNAFTVGWKAITPRHERFIAALLAYPGHVIVTVRERMKYILEPDGRGHQIPKKIGMNPIQRPDFPHGWDILCAMDVTNTMTVQARKGVGLDIHGAVVKKPGPDFVEPIKVWLGTGRRVYSLKEIGEAVRAAGLGEAELKAQMLALAPGVTSYGQLTTRQREDLYLYFTGLVTPDPVVTDPISNGQPV